MPLIFNIRWVPKVPGLSLSCLALSWFVIACLGKVFPKPPISPPNHHATSSGTAIKRAVSRYCIPCMMRAVVPGHQYCLFPFLRRNDLVTSSSSARRVDISHMRPQVAKFRVTHPPIFGSPRKREKHTNFHTKDDHKEESLPHSWKCYGSKGVPSMIDQPCFRSGARIPRW